MRYCKSPLNNHAIHNRTLNSKMQNVYNEMQYRYFLYCTNISKKVVHLEISKDFPINDSQTPRAFSISTKSTQNISF